MISVIMPTYNEAGNIRKVILRTAKTLKKNFEIIVVDDNSPDDTAAIVKGLQKEKPFLRLIVRKQERGLPSAIKRGIKEAKGNIVAWLDCDLSMPPEKLPEMIKLLDKNDIVIGSTFLDGGKDVRRVKHARFLHKLISLISRLLLGSELTDYTSGFIVAKKKAVRRTLFEGIHGSYFIDLVYRAKREGYRITEIPFVFSPRHYGQSKICGFWPYFKAGLIYLKTLIQIRLGS